METTAFHPCSGVSIGEGEKDKTTGPEKEQTIH